MGGPEAPRNKAEEFDETIAANFGELRCDPSRHLQECSGARAGKCPPECFLSVFGHLAPSAPKSAFECFVAVLVLKKRQKTLKKHSLGHSEPGAQKHSKGGHFPVRAVEHSCKWRLGSQRNSPDQILNSTQICSAGTQDQGFQGLQGRFRATTQTSRCRESNIAASCPHLSPNHPHHRVILKDHLKPFLVRETIWETPPEPMFLMRVTQKTQEGCVRKCLLEGFSGKFRRCWKIFPRFSGSTNSLILFSLPFWKTARKTTKKARQVLGKKGKTLEIVRKSLKRKEARKSKKARKED